jgi:hyperosmotically inducible protein
MRGFLVGLVMALLANAGWAAGPSPLQNSKSQDQPKLRPRAERDVRTRMALADEVRHQLVTLPYYGIFDWFEGNVQADGTVVLRGEVARPTLKSDAEARVKKLEGVRRVDNQIQVLPVSPMDDEIRLAMYRALASNSSLSKYFLQAVPPIHIIVKEGRVTLKGTVLNAMDSQIAYTVANQVPNVFEVKNELMIETQERVGEQ